MLQMRCSPDVVVSDLFVRQEDPGKSGGAMWSTDDIKPDSNHQSSPLTEVTRRRFVFVLMTHHRVSVAHCGRWWSASKQAPVISFALTGALVFNTCCPRRVKCIRAMRLFLDRDHGLLIISALVSVLILVMSSYTCSRAWVTVGD